MKSPPLFLLSAQKSSPLRWPLGFTLVEIVLALGVASVFLVGIVSLLSAGLTSLREASNDTSVSLIVRDVVNRVRGKPLVPNPTLMPPLFYTEEAEWIDPSNIPVPQPVPLFGVTSRSTLLTVNAVPSANLLAVEIEVYWPVNGGAVTPSIPFGTKPKATFTYYVTTASGIGWSEMEPSFVPKIEF